jgi:oligosaccharyltransferase complex subunit beta
MRWLFSFLLFGILGVVRALSYSGSRLLVVLEEESEREKYAVFMGDLSGKFWISFAESGRLQSA